MEGLPASKRRHSAGWVRTGSRECQAHDWDGRSYAHGTRLLLTCTASGAAVRSTVDALTFRAVTRTLLFDHTWQSSTKAMQLVSSEASATSPRRAPGTVTSMLAVAPGPRLGRSQVVSSARRAPPPPGAGSPAAPPSPGGASAGGQADLRLLQGGDELEEAVTRILGLLIGVGGAAHLGALEVDEPALAGEYGGVEHVVTVTRTGYEYGGQPYQSLSAIARAITGTRWNGRVFFGLRPSRSAA